MAKEAVRRRAPLSPEMTMDTLKRATGGSSHMLPGRVAMEAVLSRLFNPFNEGNLDDFLLLT